MSQGCCASSTSRIAPPPCASSKQRSWTEPLREAAADGFDRALNAVLGAELLEDVREVMLGGSRADEKGGRDLDVALAGDEQRQHLPLALRERGDASSRCLAPLCM